MKKILVTGSGGIGGVNFVRALRATNEEFFLVGTDFNKYYLEFPDVNLRVNTPRHSDSTFLPQIKKIVNEYQIDFVHPQPSSEALVISQDNELKSKTFLPSSTVIANDKLTTQKILSEKISQLRPGSPPMESQTQNPMVRHGARLSTLYEEAEEDHWPDLGVS